jgi:23S rRNA pseudouridine1911/1915/1917 synthase
VRAPEFAVPEEHKRLAISEYKTIKKFEKELFKSASQKSLNYMTYLNVRIFTGRTHQIRAQMAEIHHPIIGDLLYGGKLMRQINQKLDISRQFLHAHQLEFKHPVTGKTIKLESKLPYDLKKVIKLLRALR